MNSSTFHHHQPATSLTLSRKIKNENWKLAKVIFISLYNKIKEAGWAEEKFCSMLWGLCKCSHPLYSESERESEIERYNAIQCEKSVLFAPFFTFTWSFKCIFGHSPFVAELFCIAPSSRTDLSFVVRYTKLLDIHSLVYVCIYVFKF